MSSCGSVRAYNRRNHLEGALLHFRPNLLLAGSRVYARVEQELRERNRQQSAIAELGQFAIQTQDLSSLIDEATAAAARTLGTDYSAALELLPSGDGLVVRSGIGWYPGFVGSHTAAAGTGSASGFVLSSDAPVVIAELSTETRFTPPKSLLDHGVVSAMHVIVRGRRRPWGTLSVHTKRRRTFTSDDLGFLQSVANILALALERDELEVAQRHERETLQAIFDNIPVMISIDRGGRRPRVNAEWERTLGWTLEEAEGPRPDGATLPGPVGRHPWTDSHLRTRDGGDIDVSWARFALSDGSRISLGLDITERKRAEKALAESEMRFAKIFRASPVALGMSTMTDGRIIDVNDAWLDLFGYRREDVVGRTNVELNLSVSRQDRGDALDRVRRDGDMRMEIQVRRKTGEIRDLIVSAVATDVGGARDFWISAMVDITDRKQADAERRRLLESESAARTQAEAAFERLCAIQNVTEPALAYMALPELMRELLARVRIMLETDYATVLLLDEGRKVLNRSAHHGFSCDEADATVPLAGSLSGRVACEGRALIFNGLGPLGWPHPDFPPGLSLRAAMGAPLVVEAKVTGVLLIASAGERTFKEADLSLLRVVADRVAPTIERGRLVERVRAGRERLKAMSRRLLTAQEEERRRIAVELHDDLGQVLTAAKISMESAERSSGPAAPMQLTEAIAYVDQATQMVRNLALDLRPSVLDDLGLAAALRWFIDRFAQKAALETHLSIDAAMKLDPALETTCFRLAQEALTNVARHAQARHVWFDLHLLGNDLELSIRDDGVGFDTVAARARATGGASLGLLGMEERVSLAGGEFELVSERGTGTEVHARFPVGPKPGAFA